MPLFSLVSQDLNSALFLDLEISSISDVILIYQSAMLTGDGELAAYDFAWTSLLNEISQALAFGDISDTTLTVAT